MVKICPECKAENSDEQIYCQDCYAKLELAKTAIWKEEVGPAPPVTTPPADDAAPPVEEAEASEPAPPEGPATEPEPEPVVEEAPPEAPPKQVSKEDAMKVLKKAKVAMKAAKEGGKDIGKAKKLFQEAKPALADGDYARAAGIGKRILGMLK